MLRVLFAERLGSIGKVLMNEVFRKCTLCEEERMRNVNEKINLKCVRNVTDVFWLHFTECLERVHGACMNIQNH